MLNDYNLNDLSKEQIIGLLMLVVNSMGGLVQVDLMPEGEETGMEISVRGNDGIIVFSTEVRPDVE